MTETSSHVDRVKSIELLGVDGTADNIETKERAEEFNAKIKIVEEVVGE